MTTSICFVSSKGGSGKTVTSSAIGTFLSTLGFSTLLIDTDAATNGMTLLYLDQLLGFRRQNGFDSSQVGLFESLGRFPSLVKINDNLDLIPASFSMKNTEDTDRVAFKDTLTTIVNQFDSYDFILLDAQAGSDQFARAAAEVADQCVIVSEYDPVSAQGIERLKVLFADQLSPSSTWTLFNKVLPEFASVIGEGLSVARYLPPIPWDADVVRSFARRDLAVNMETPNPYTLAIAQVVYGLAPDETGDAIERWRGHAFEVVSTPIKAALDDISVLKRHLKMNERRRERMAKALTIAVTSFGVAAASGAISIFTKDGLAFALFQRDDTLIPITMGLFAGGGVLLFAIYSWIKNIYVNAPWEFKENDILEQERKLITSLQAAEALKMNNNAGYYERRRRASAPVV